MKPIEHSPISRREFLKTVSTSAAGLAVIPLLADPTLSLAAEGPANDQAWGVLVDTTRCVGCNSCALACKEANQLPDCGVTPARLDCRSYTFVDTRQATSPEGGSKTVHIKRQCMHCLHPACVSACTVGALRKTEAGPVVYDADKCIGCRYCQYACPFGIPTYEWSNPVGLIHKCQLCIARLEQDQEPACATACPTGAIRFGKRQALLAQARAQIVSNPKRYVDHIYGEHEVGGTSVLYLSAVPFAALGFPTLGSQPIPRYAEQVMKGTPAIAVSVAVLTSGLYWTIKWREQKLARKAPDPSEDQAEQDLS